ncbi:MAG: DHA2 family efflux MFS transporter permease subunit [Patescibacteria group bacterium]|nr:DHA2 family efflux MFS transporter permease subunit [Patescibacteria group bacterium]
MSEAQTGDKLRWVVLATVVFGTFLGRLDQTVVNLALPKIIGDFGITVSGAAWISTAYILANAVFVPIWGKLGDVAGRKRIYIIGFIGFIVASGLCAIAWNLTSMVVFRVIQGFAVSADYPTAMAILAVTFLEDRERAQALGIWSAAFAVASVFGPLIGGPLIDNFSWRAVFFINIPLGIVGLFLALTFIKESVGVKREAHFDWWGASSLAAALFALTLVLDRGQTWGWSSAGSVISYAVFVVFMVIFILIERRETEPIINLSFFKVPAFVFSLLNNFVVFMAMMGGVFLIPIFAETFLGYSATQTGYLFIPMAVVIMASSILGGRLVGKIESRYVIFVGTVIAAAGLYMLSALDIRSTALDIILPMSVLAFGLGSGMAQRTNIVAISVPKRDIGEASAVLALVRNIAGAFGIAVFTVILDSAININLLSIAQNSVLRIVNQANLRTFESLILLKAQIAGYDTVFIWAGIIIFLGSFTALLIKVPNELKLRISKREIALTD